MTVFSVVVLAVTACLGLRGQAVDPVDEILAAERDKRIKAFRSQLQEPKTRKQALAGFYELIQDESGTESLLLRAKAISTLGLEKPFEAEEFLRRLWNGPEAHPKLKYVAHSAWLEVFLAQEHSVEEKTEVLREVIGRGCRWRSSIRAAIKEFGNLGAKHALNEIEQGLRCLVPSEREEALWIAITKIELLSQEPDRFKALQKALEIEDPTTLKKVNVWAVQELGKLGSQEAYNALVERALAIQRKYFVLGADGELRLGRATRDPTSRFPWDHHIYSDIAEILHKVMSEEGLRRRGLRTKTVALSMIP